MKTKKGIMLAIGLAGVLNLCGQDFMGIVAGDNLIKKINAKSIVVIEQSYQLKDAKGRVYGIDNQPEFGKVYSLGFVTEQGFVVDDKVIHPWNYDSNYDEYRNNRDYGVVWSSTAIKPFGGNDFSKIECGQKDYEDLSNGRFMLSCETDGLVLSDTTGKVDGWMVWIMHPSQTEIDKDLDFNVYVAYSQSVDVKSNDFVVYPPQNTQMAIGGIFIVPSITAIGSVTFELCGVAYKENSDWKLFSVVQEKKKVDEKKPEAKDKENDKDKPKKGGKLTPVDKKKGDGQ